MIDLRHGRWQTVLAAVTCDAVIVDPPYSARTHGSDATRRDGSAADGLTPDYEAWTADHVQEFVSSWSPRCSGWIVCMTDHELIGAYEAAYRAAGRYAFAPVACCIAGMTCRMQGDGPSSEVVYAMAARPRTEAFIGGWTSRGYYNGPSGHGGGKGRGKPSWLEHALVRAFSRPGDLVCDPMAGFGGTLAAAESLGRRAVGSEMDADAFKEAQRRLSRPQQIDMFGGAA